MKAHLIDTHLLVSRSSATVKVKYQGHVSQKIGVSGALVFHKLILGFFFLYFLDIEIVLILYQANQSFNSSEENGF